MAGLKKARKLAAKKAAKKAQQYQTRALAPAPTARAISPAALWPEDQADKP